MAIVSQTFSSRLLPRGIGIGLLSSLWLGFLALALTPIYIRLLGIESYGLIGLYTAMLAMTGMLDVALSSTTGREMARMMDRVGGAASIACLLRSTEAAYAVLLLLSLAVYSAAAWLLGAGWIRAGGLPTENVRTALLLMGGAIVAVLPSGLYTASLTGLQLQGRAAGLLAVFGTVRGVGAALVAWLVSADIRSFFLWLTLFGLIQSLWLRRQVWRCVEIDRDQARFDWKVLCSIRNGIGAMFFITVLGVLVSQMDRLVLSTLVSLEILGYYALAWSAAAALTLIASPIAQGLGASLSRLGANDSGQEAFVAQLAAATELVLALALPAAIAISMYAQPIVHVWVRDVRIAEAAAPLLAILAPGTALLGAAYPLLNGLYARQRYRPVMIIQLVCAAFYLPLLWYAVMESGAIGAAWCWATYGVVLFGAYGEVSARVHMASRLRGTLFLDVLLVGASSVAIHMLFGGWALALLARGKTAGILAMGALLVCAWAAAICLCADLRRQLLVRLGFVFGRMSD